MNNSQTKEVKKDSQINFESLPLSKKNLLLLFENKKVKLAKSYINQLKNSNPKAQKIIKETLHEIFVLKKISTATAYLYALVFYKNLLCSGQLDYYQDDEYFSYEIHDAILSLSEYNDKQQNVKKKGLDYFSKTLKPQKSDPNQDIQSIGTTVVMLAMQILQSMAQWYKIDYFTQEQSRYAIKYKKCIQKRIVFPKKQEYVYVKQQDKKQFQANYKQFLQNQQQLDQSNVNNSSPAKNDNINSSLQNPSSVKQKEIKQQTQKVPQDNKRKQVHKSPQHKQLNTKKDDEKEQFLSIGKLQSKIQQPTSHSKDSKPITQNNKKSLEKQKKEQVQIKKSPNKQTSKQSNTLLSQVKKKEVIKEQPKPNVPITNNNPGNNSKIQILKKHNQDLKLSPQQKKSQQKSIQKQTKSKQITIQDKNQKIKQVAETKVQPNPRNSIQKNQKSISSNLKQQNPRLSSQIIKKQQQSTFKNQNTNAILKSKNNVQNHSRKKIFQNNPSSLIKQQKQPNQQNNTSTQSTKRIKIQKCQRARGPSQIFKNQIENKNSQINLMSHRQSNQFKNVVDSNMSFSPKFNKTFYQKTQKSKKKSVPKTQKKFLQNTFSALQQNSLNFVISQSFNKNNKFIKSTQKIPVKTLSTWRYQKQFRMEFTPKEQNKQALIYLLSRLKFNNQIIPFIPQYFSPVTLKMVGLRKAALQICNFSETSQVFFNNKIVQARLLKPGNHIYVLSLLNVSKKVLKICPGSMGKQKYAKQIKIIGNEQKKYEKTILNPGCYFDIKFTFQTQDLNFKFLPFDLQIDNKILHLELPITLLDQCKISKQISVDEISSYRKQKGKIYKSPPLRINLKQLPNFMKMSPYKINQDRNTKSDMDLRMFGCITVKFDLQDEDEQGVLSCFLSQKDVSKSIYELNIILNTQNQQIQNFGKVMLELIAFLLCQ